MEGKQVCVTGANGFIGRHLVDALLQQGCLVRVLTRQPDFCPPAYVQVIIGDLTSPNCQFDQFLEGCEVLYHCAGEVLNPLRMEALHVEGTRRLTVAASGVINHWVQLSSVGVYGPVSHGLIDEHSTLNPIGTYEVTKEKSDQIIIDAAMKGGFSYSILRPSNVYGRSMTNQSLFNMIAMIDKGLFFYIGKSGASVNYIHVDNVVEGLLLCGKLNSAKGKVYNLSDYCSLEFFVNVICTELGRVPPKLRMPRAVSYFLANTLGKFLKFPLTQSRINALVNCSIYPISAIQHETGYIHVKSMEEGLRELVAEYKKRLRRCELK